MTINHSTNWDGIRHTDKKAVPMSHDNVRNAYVVWVEEATIRGAVIKNQHLEVAERSTIGALFQGKPSVEVFCTWYGRKPLTSWMHITQISRSRGTDCTESGRALASLDSE
jgi:hypothetical protein